jgi:formylglycine-generating enzyme required for sulfatase activity
LVGVVGLGVIGVAAAAVLLMTGMLNPGMLIPALLKTPTVGKTEVDNAISDPSTQNSNPESEPVPVITRVVSEKDGMVLLPVPEGEFEMGSTEAQYQNAVEMCVNDGGNRSDCERWYVIEKSQHTVWLDAFRIDQTEVTNAMYASCVAAGMCKRSSYAYTSDFNNASQPVVGVDWNDASAYCAWAGRRLPTEAEWEKAARGTDGRVYPWGDQPLDAQLLNYNNNLGKTSDAGSFPAGVSPYGALDMTGNAWEWVADWYDGSYYSSSPDRNPGGPSSGGTRVLRGGSWYDNVRSVRAAYRHNTSPDSRYASIGFRCAASDPSAQISNPESTPVPVITRVVSEKDGMVLLPVPEGEFEMGLNDGNDNEKPVHTVWLDAYWIDQTEVTNAMFAQFSDQNLYETDAEKAG